MNLFRSVAIAGPGAAPLVDRPCPECRRGFESGDVAILIPQDTCVQNGVIALHRSCVEGTTRWPTTGCHVGRRCAACRRRVTTSQDLVVIHRVPGMLVVGPDVTCVVHAACMTAAVAAAPDESPEATIRHLEGCMETLERGSDPEWMDYRDGLQLYPPVAA